MNELTIIQKRNVCSCANHHTSNFHMMMRSKSIRDGFNNYEKSSLKALEDIVYPVLGTSVLLHL